MVRAELLDGLPPDDRRARRSRRDLRRIHFAMRSRSILKSAIARLRIERTPRRILELGAGDGTLLLRLLRSLRTKWPGGDVVLLDRHDLVSAATKAHFLEIGWKTQVLRTDAIEWARSTARDRYDLCVTTLFLHHFQPSALAALLAAVADSTDAFVACEPYRSALSRIGSRLLLLLGANAVTRHDAVTSVAAGFADHEISALWPASSDAWLIEEYCGAPFTHCFAARRTLAQRPPP